MSRLDRQLLGASLASLALSVVLMLWGSDYTRPAKAPPLTPLEAESLTPVKQRRLPDNTYLTYPEWFLVFSPREYAAYVREHTPTDFPYLGHLAQFWTGYAEANRQARPYGFNFDYHLMNFIIGASTTAEFLVKASYEATVGRVSQALAWGEMTDEDKFSARQSADYARLLDTKAWYDYPYFDDLKGLWRLPVFGPGFLRKLERRYILTTDYAFKGIYGHLMYQAARASYEPEVPQTALLDSQGRLHSLPRYQAFQDEALALAKQGMQFQEIAGNRQGIMVCYQAPAGTLQLPEGSTLLFSQPLLTQPQIQRVVLRVPIDQLHRILQQIPVEHVFDF
ncbi:MAG: hypothetical protein KF760_07805 [Candidatus Eremiobacteraeota bacterium]|nr:hypothetical protein [Candidatus Eremiobacteraeota bacterium]MCW5871091.1 hypothetical protein [Candidatus Eremiobacteraeota bacterium]